MKTYKFTDSKMTCKGHKFEVGVRYEIEGDLILCENGFHSCVNGISLLNYYTASNSRLFECEVVGEWIGYLCDKICSRDIKLIKELTFYEAMRILNDFTGDENSNLGFGNKGNDNAGNSNIGNSNLGSRNIGNSNMGNYNTGNYNTGNYNIGNDNKGNDNAGSRNIGNSNMGNDNKGNKNIGNDNTGNYKTNE